MKLCFHVTYTAKFHFRCHVSLKTDSDTDSLHFNYNSKDDDKFRWMNDIE